MKIKAALLFVILLFPAFSFSQGIKKSVADGYYNNLHYALAVRHYEEILKKDPENIEVMEKVATCYRKMNDPEHAENWYGKLIEIKDTNHLIVLYYAQVLAANKKYALSLKWYKRYAEIAPYDSRGEAFSKEYEHMDHFYADRQRYTIKPVSFNGATAEFSPMFYGNGLIFPTSRGKQVFIKRIFNWNKQPFLSLYYAETDSAEAKRFSSKINTKYHEGPLVFVGSEDTMLITRNNYYKAKANQNSEGVNTLHLYWAYRKDNKWGDVTPFEFNDLEFSTGHPAYNAKTKELYFISDLPDKSSGTDIFVVKRDESGKWSIPKNLGKIINTRGNEMFPFIDAEGNLYFASDGHAGLGGLDVFFAEWNGSSFEKPINLGEPINSNRDDFGYIMNNAGTAGYLSSNREGGKGDDDIYAYTRKPEPSIMLKVNVQDVYTKALLDSVSVKVTDTCKFETKSFTTGSNGIIILKARKKCNYKITAARNKYQPKTIHVSDLAHEHEDTLHVTLPMTPILTCVTLSGQVMDKVTNKPLPWATIHIKKPDGEIMVFHADDKGNYNFCIAPDKTYMFKATKAKYLSDCFSINISKPKGKEYSPAKSLKLQPLKLNMTFKIENLLYDLAKSDIRPDAALELDKVLAFLQENESIKIELGSHTDSRGSDKYNLVLSDQRANSAVNYIISKGIDPNRIVAKGYGETKPLNKCKNKVKCSEPEYQKNRRTEIKVIGFVNVVEKLDDAHEKELFDDAEDIKDCETVEGVLKK